VTQRLVCMMYIPSEMVTSVAWFHRLMSAASQ